MIQGQMWTPLITTTALLAAYQLVYDKQGLRQVDYLIGQIALGTYHRLRNGKWRQRIKRRTGGHTWKPLEMRQVPKKILMEMLVLGVT